MTEQEKIISLAKACKLHCGDFGVGALMNTEDKIREAFTKSFPNDCYPVASFTLFRAGYMALLNELEFTRLLNADGKLMMTYKLPEGVTK